MSSQNPRNPSHPQERKNEPFAEIGSKGGKNLDQEQKPKPATNSKHAVFHEAHLAKDKSIDKKSK